MGQGRPSTYSDEVADRLCENIAAGRSVHSLCAEDWAPAERTFYQWLEGRGAPEAFAQKYARAIDRRSDRYAAEVIEIADDQTDDPNSRRVRVDARKWVAARLTPRKYGDRLEHAGKTEIVYRIKTHAED